MKEAERVESLSNWYCKDQLNFDRRLIGYRYKTILPFLRGPLGLELGSGDGQMTKFLVNNFEQLTVVEGSANLLSVIPEHPNLKKVHSLFEDYKPTVKFNSIIMEHILEHIEEPVELLRRAKNWLSPDGLMFIGVPNANSFHRLAAVKMGLLKTPDQLNDRDAMVGHRRVYTTQTLKEVLLAAELNVVKMGGCYFKPLSNQQIQENWSEQMLEGFYELGKDFEENAAELYAICSL